ncbi:DUF3299 domain-containing protein [Yoonia sediminilitoris]|uniref:DUF3299 domain-containing protein n=1 Tax=Yoonia sediminilitoris TaxID=1286148 RepID=A0A2T6K9B3_9RHOB|nr:DUF3299 domain-containing protein [Yoonia sediminilitoris]PUB11349.1 hypothetical protein C8N45_114124 [Yoonia sediminilitoris]RCW91166.1 hypothetical protein DFP92_114125 [Yoonia sediminilitoris]
MMNFKNTSSINRRQMLGAASVLVLGPRAAMAETPLPVTWDMLIPPGVPYSEIIGEGDMDEVNDIWKPIYDANATKLNEALAGAYIRMPGFIVPLDLTSAGTSAFILVPYVGACIHTPPPPPNQLVYTTVDPPRQIEDPWNAVWVTGTMSTQLKSTEIAETGYALVADEIELFTW